MRSLLSQDGPRLELVFPGLHLAVGTVVVVRVHLELELADRLDAAGARRELEACPVLGEIPAADETHPGLKSLTEIEPLGGDIDQVGLVAELAHISGGLAPGLDSGLARCHVEGVDADVVGRGEVPVHSVERIRSGAVGAHIPMGGDDSDIRPGKDVALHPEALKFVLSTSSPPTAPVWMFMRPIW